MIKILLFILNLIEIIKSLEDQTNYKCDYDLDLFNCLNINCSGKKNLHKLPTNLKNLIGFGLDEKQFLCSLDLSETSISELSSHTLENFNLFFHNLVKANPNQTYTTLKLSFSGIEFIKELRLPTVNLVLFIRDSNVRYIQPKCLSSNLKLELNLINLTMSSINWFHLLDSTKLKLLNLRNIENLKEEFKKSNNQEDLILYPIASIIDIKIYHSYLPVLDDYFYLFKLLKYVEQLELISCSISFIKNSIFEKYSNTFRYLKYLTLASNNLNKISDQTFNGLSNLVYLDLDDNPIEYVHPNAFIGLKRLKVLSLNNIYNKNLKTIGSMSNPYWLFNIFKSNRDLQEINFKTNRLLKNNFCILNTIVQTLNNINDNLKEKQENLSLDTTRTNRYLKLFTQEELEFSYEYKLNDKNSYCSVYFVCKYAIDYSKSLFDPWLIEYFKSCSTILTIENMDLICDTQKKISECKNFYESKNKNLLSQSSKLFSNQTNLKRNLTVNKYNKSSSNSVLSKFSLIVIVSIIIGLTTLTGCVSFMIYSYCKKKKFNSKNNNSLNTQMRRRTRSNWSPDAYGSDYYVVLVNRNQVKI